MTLTRSPWFLAAPLALLATGLASLVYFIDPRVPGNYPPCPFLFFSGCYCPGCGTLRALHSLIRGDLSGALGYNPLMVLALPVCAAIGAGGLTRAVNRPLSSSFLGSPHFAWGALAVIVLFWVARNIPIHPLTILAP